MRKVIFLLFIVMFFFKTPATANYEKKFLTSVLRV